MNKPNIIFILTDQQRFDTCGCYGQKLDITPNLDNLAEKGVVFEYAFTNQPVCGPARSILQTGKYATETGCYRNGIALSTKSKTIAHYLSEKGYTVAYVGKWHLASTLWNSKEDIEKPKDYMNKAVPPELRGGYKDFWRASDVLEYTSHPFEGYLFDENMNKLEFTGYRVDALTDYAIEFLDLYGEKKPFFLYLSYLEPHQQNDLNRFVGPMGSQKRFRSFEIPGDLKGTEGDWIENFPDYLGCCKSIDCNIKRIQDKLKQLGIEKKTIIIYTSDHGCHFKTRNEEYKRSCHEASIRVPLIIKGLEFLGGKKISELVSIIDIPTTILKWANISIPQYMRGRPLQELLKDSEKLWPQEIFIQISGYRVRVGRAIRTKRWKYSVKNHEKSGFLYGQSEKYVEDELYDLENDPFEKINLIEDSDYHQIKVNLSEILKIKMKEAGEKVPQIIPKIKYNN